LRMMVGVLVLRRMLTRMKMWSRRIVWMIRWSRRGGGSVGSVVEDLEEASPVADSSPGEHMWVCMSLLMLVVTYWLFARPLCFRRWRVLIVCSCCCRLLARGREYRCEMNMHGRNGRERAPYLCLLV
jgi:hypothetical protein